ncbi:serine protease 27 [Macrosteles quadrilineatus]|uniref:serine protease 27 n=1 Tax=Macrosteles quadrilineatus TaxID=74068 RepID=UPI0023E25348|nr:serine protease 27 [Macrosteles quadrilineatus]
MKGRLLGYPSTCEFRGVIHSCTLSLACWLVGGTLTGGCGGDLLSDWLFTCCVTPHPPHHLRQQPLRRWGLHHHPPPQVECGTPVAGIQKRIIGGAEANFGEFPWQAHIRISGYQCGGVLVNSRYVATAAHCIYRARVKDIMVYLGEFDTQNTGQYFEPVPEEAYRVIKKIIHPKFQYRLSQPDRYDVALLRLARPTVYRDNILPICLPQRGETFSGETGVVAGWGKTDTTYGKTGTNILQKAFVPILSDEKCVIWHKHKRIKVELHEEMFCAGHSDGHMDACLGDSGGPLVVYHKTRQRWTLAGITSAGFGCAVDHQPGIYHKVTHTTDWIANKINN